MPRYHRNTDNPGISALRLNTFTHIFHDRCYLMYHNFQTTANGFNANLHAVNAREPHTIDPAVRHGQSQRGLHKEARQGESLQGAEFLVYGVHGRGGERGEWASRGESEDGHDANALLVQ